MAADERLHVAIRDQIAARERFTPREDRGELPQAGEIRLTRALASDRQRLVLVLQVEKDRNFADVCLLSNEPEMMSDFDVLLPRSNTGLPFDVVAQLDLVAPVYLIQASNLFGEVRSPSLLCDLREAVLGSVSHISPGSRGLPIRGPGDPRWAFKEDELSALQEISSQCAQDIADGTAEVRTIIDPALLNEAMERSGEEGAAAFEDLLSICEAAQGAVASSDQISALLDGLEELAGGDRTLLTALQPLLEAGLSAPGGATGPPSEVGFSPGRSADDEIADQQFESILAGVAASEGGRVLRVLTTHAAWAGLEHGTGRLTIQFAGHEPIYAEAVDPRTRRAA